MSATPAERARMADAAAHVRGLLSRARLRLVVAGPAAYQWEGLRLLENRTERWATVWRRWAEAGRRDDGTAFSVGRYLEHGQVLASEAASLADEAWDSSLFVLPLVQAAGATAVQVQQGAAAAVQTVASNPRALLWGVGALVALVVVVQLRAVLR